MPNAELGEVFHPSVNEEHSEKTKNTEKVSELQEKLRQGDRKLYDWVKEHGDKLPDWVPVVAPLRDWMMSEWRTAHGMSFKENIETQQQYSSTKELLTMYAKGKAEALWNQGRTALDIGLLIGTQGSGTVVEAAGGAVVKKVGTEVLESAGGAVAKKAAGEVVEAAGGKIAAEAVESKTANQVLERVNDFLKKSGSEGFEESLVEQIPGALQGLAGKLEAGKGKEVAETMAKLYDKLAKNEITRKGMAEWLKNNEQWKELKSTAGDESKRQEKIEDLKKSASFESIKGLFALKENPSVEQKETTASV